MSFFSDLFGGGSSTNTVTSSSQPPAQFQNALSGALANVQQVGSTPYSQYTGQMVAPFNPVQGAAFNAVANYANSAQPYFQNAGNAISASTKPLLSSIAQPFNSAINSWLPNAALSSTVQAAGPSISNAAQQGAGGIMNAAGAYQPGNIGQWLSPYTQNVVNATQQQFGNQNAQEASSLAGNAISSGAWGGDRAQVAQGIAAGQEQLAQAPVIANLEQQGYGQALNALGTQSQLGLQGATAAGSLGLQGASSQAQQQQATAQQLLGLTQGQQNLALGANEANAWLNSQAGYGLANIGNAVQGAGLSGANAVLGIGNLAQQQQQANLNVPYEQWVAQQAYPFQTLGWGTSQLEGLSSAAGGTASTTYPQPSPWSQALGSAAALTGIGAQTGAFGANGWLTGGGSAPNYGIASTGSAFGSPTGLASYYNSGVAADSGAAASGSSYFGARRGGRLAASSPWHGNDNWMPREPMRRAAGGDDWLSRASMHRADGGDVPGGAQDGAETALAVLGDIAAGRPLGASAAPQAQNAPAMHAPQPTAGYGPPSLAPAPSSAHPESNWGRMLTDVGLGIMGGNSPFALQNIGQGALRGLNIYDQQKAQDFAQGMKQSEQENTNAYRSANLGMQSRHLSDLADEARQRLAQQDKQIANERSYQQGQLGLRSTEIANAEQARRDALTPPELRMFKATEGMTPQQKADFANFQATSKGMFPTYTAQQFAQGADAGAPGAGSAPAQNAPGALSGDAFLQTLPGALQPVIKALAQGRQALPTRITPQSQQLIQLTGQYDPTFDQTDYNKRNRTATDFSAGQSAKGVAAINTAMAHLSTLDTAFSALGNGQIPTWNAAVNFMRSQLGDAAPNNAMEARDAVSNELRRVFATTGGGGLEELRGWQDRFPVNGSPDQQKAAIREAIGLMDGRLNALSDRYNQGMGTNHSTADLLSPEARQSYERLTGAQPQAADRSRTYAAPGSGAQGVTPLNKDQAASIPIPPMNARVAGKVYPTPKGPMAWTGTGWLPAAQ